jgi:hypothetical protein
MRTQSFCTLGLAAVLSAAVGALGAVVPARTIGNSMVLSTNGGILWGNLTLTDATATSVSVLVNGAQVRYEAWVKFVKGFLRHARRPVSTTGAVWAWGAVERM